MAKEEETSTCTSALTSLKDHISVELRAETCKDDIWCDSVALLDAFEIERSVHIYLDHRVDSDLVKVDLPLLLQLLFSLGEAGSFAGFRAVILVKVLHLHDIPDGRVFYHDLVELDLALVDPALDLAVLLATAALLNRLELLGELLDAFQDDVDQLNVEAGGEERVESLFYRVPFTIFLLASAKLPHHLLECLPDKRL